MTRLSDLTAGTRIRHLRWGTTGIVQVEDYGSGVGGPLVHVKWEGHFTDDEISEQGPVYPEDLEITGA